MHAVVLTTFALVPFPATAAPPHAPAAWEGLWSRHGQPSACGQSRWESLDILRLSPDKVEFYRGECDIVGAQERGGIISLTGRRCWADGDADSWSARYQAVVADTLLLLRVDEEPWTAYDRCPPEPGQSAPSR